jgi:hypothetical protein
LHEWIEPPVFLGLVLTARVVDCVNAVRKSSLLECPLHAKIAREADDFLVHSAKSIEGDHGLLLAGGDNTRRLPRGNRVLRGSAGA